MPVISGNCTTVGDMRCELAVALDASVVHNGWTQNDAAKRLGLTQPTVSNMRVIARERSMFPTHTPDARRARTSVLSASLSALGGHVEVVAAPPADTSQRKPVSISLTGTAEAIHVGALAIVRDWMGSRTLREVAETTGYSTPVLADARALRLTRMSMDTALSLALDTGAAYGMYVHWPEGVSPYLPAVPSLRVVDAYRGARGAYTHVMIEEARHSHTGRYRVVIDGDDIITRMRMPSERLIDPDSPKGHAIDTAIEWWREYELTTEGVPACP